MQPEGERYATPVGGREVITLFDGSQVELNTDTAVRVAPGADRPAIAGLIIRRSLIRTPVQARHARAVPCRAHFGHAQLA